MSLGIFRVMVLGFMKMTLASIHCNCGVRVEKKEILEMILALIIVN